MRPFYHRIRPLVRHDKASFSRWTKRSATQSAVKEQDVQITSKISNLMPLKEEEGAVYDKKVNRAVRHARLELKWLNDEKSISDRVRKCLNQKQPLKALEIAKLASNTPDNAIIAWNHLIRYQLNRNPPQIELAMEMFKQMKRRHQTPDSYTLSIILNGILRKPLERKAAVRAFEAFSAFLKVRPKAYGKANDKHFNQMLTICAKSANTKVLWQVVDVLPEDDKNIVSSQTYTIILQTLRSALQTRDLDDAMIEDNVTSAIRIWNIVIQKWSKGQLLMDSYLICTMAKILSLSRNSYHHVAVFSLIEQTTGIKSHAPTVRSSKPSTDEAPPPSVELLFPATKLDKKTKLFVPNTRLLQSILEACAQLRAKSSAKFYWSELTDEKKFDIKPDLPNLKSYMEVLRLTRSSTDALDLIQKFSKQLNLDVGTYQMAMSSCARNINKPNVSDEAVELYNLRQKDIKEADMKFLNNFLMVGKNTKDAKKRDHIIKLIAQDVCLTLDYPGLGWKIKDTFKDDEINMLNLQSLQVIKILLGEIDKLINKNAVEPKSFGKSKQILGEFVRATQPNNQ